MTLADQPLINRLSDGRLQLRHGPIDLVVEAFGSCAEMDLAYQQAIAAFNTVLGDLVCELKDLRKPLQAGEVRLSECRPALSMYRTASVYASGYFVTPMIAVAGAVADHILKCMTNGRSLSRAYVNNGGDIALHLLQGECFEVGVCANMHKRTLASTVSVTHASNIRGLATSGWRGRSHSFGIADAVTVLATDAATADAAATLIANAIDLPDHPNIQRSVASDLSPDSDLGERKVTVDVGELTDAEVLLALAAGKRRAQKMIDDKQIIGVYATLNEEMFTLHEKTDGDTEFLISSTASVNAELQLHCA